MKKTTIQLEIPPQGYELITDPNDTCKEGDLVWIAKWENALGFIGKPIDYCIAAGAYVVRPKAKPVFNDESFNNVYNPQLQAKFKVGDKVFYGLSNAVWTIESIDSGHVNYRYNIKDVRRGRLGVAYEWLLRPARLVRWTPETRPSGMVWVRNKGAEKTAILVTTWGEAGFASLPQHHNWVSYECACSRFEWSPDGKTNWQPCGNYVEATCGTTTEA